MSGKVDLGATTRRHSSPKLWTFVAITLVAGLVIGWRYGFDSGAEAPKPLPIDLREIASDVESREEVPCPRPDDAFNLVLFGQSNIANGVGHRFPLPEGEQILNRFKGKCYIARDPMLGATGDGGSIAIPLASALETDKVVVVDTFGVSNTRAQDWLEGGRVREHFLSQKEALQAAPAAPDFFVWMQGEADRFQDIPAFQDSLMKLMQEVQATFPDTPLGITGTSYCGAKPEPRVVEAQRAVADELGLVWLSNTDRFSTPEDRYDECHLSERGARKVAASIAESINAYLAAQ